MRWRAPDGRGGRGHGRGGHGDGPGGHRGGRDGDGPSRRGGGHGGGWGGHGVYQGPKVRVAVAVTVSHRVARSRPLTSARQRRVSAVRAGSLGRPRLGTGVRNGASVSARMRSAGAAAAASLSGWALANVTLPANDIT